MAKQQFIEAGKIVNTHGVNGEVKIEVWLDSPEFMKKFKRVFCGDKELKIMSAFAHKGFLIAKLENVDGIDSANLLRNKTLRVNRDDVRLPQGTYYLQDIMGADVVDENDNKFGTLTDIIESPASNIYVVNGVDGKEHLIPAVPAFILSTDADNAIIKVRLIEGL